MLRVKLIRNLLIISVTVAVLLPLYQHFIVHSSYTKLLIQETEDEAVRYASYMARTLGLEGRMLSKDNLPDGLQDHLQPVGRDKRLIKLRIFSTAGEIVFSTKPDEVGRINENTYFTQVVANGRVYSKVVKKNHQTADGALADIDIVETYVPFMVKGAFAGAFEVYYDITDSFARQAAVSRQSMILILLMAGGFLVAIVFALYRAYVSFQEKAAAELALQAANEDLEQRVAERTQELSSANEQLAEQVAQRAKAQTDLSAALEAIKLDREKLDGILSSVPDGVVVTDNSLNVLHLNVVAENILDCSLSDVIGQSVDNLSKEIDFVKKIGQRLNNIYGSPSFDFELPVEGGLAPKVYSVRISQLKSEESVSAGVVLLIRDVTRERDVERMKNAFLGMAAHELNTPLTTIIGYTELLTSAETAGNFSKQQQEDYLKLVHDKALSLAGLIDDLLDISRIESGRQMVVNYAEFSMNGLVTKVAEEYSDHSEGHQLELELPTEELIVCADQTRLEQVVGHLLSNAIKYSPGGGQITASVYDHGEKFELAVEDEGIGMNDEQLEHIFDRFYRADASDTAVQGVGLGMSIVRHIVLAHHGDIKVDSQLGNGTKVTLVLPKSPTSSHGFSSQPFSS